MEFTCSLLNIKLTEIFKVKFCTNYEKFIHIVPNFRKIKLFHIPASTHTHNIFIVSYPFFMLAYEAPVSSSRKYRHKQLKLYRYSNTTCCNVPCMTFIDVL
jgi:hypothetical protein